MTVYFVLGSIIALLVALVSGKIKPAYLFSGLVFLYYLTGVIDLNTLLSNFVNPALITLVVLIFIGFVLEKTPIIQAVAKRIFSDHLSTSIAKMGIFVGLSSAMLNNTAVVSSLLPFAGKNGKLPPSKFLIPLSYVAIFGGTLTLVGTSTHLIINGFVIQAGLPALEMFDFFMVGGVLLLAGVLLLMIIAPKLLPAIRKREPKTEEYFIEARLSKDSSLIGQTIEKAGLRHLEDLFLVQVISGTEVFGPVSPSYQLKLGDRLLFVGDIQASSKLLLLPGVSMPGVKGNVGRDQKFVEVVLSHQSPLVGVSIKNANFRNKFNAAVVAIRRGSQELTGRLAEVELNAGDTLVLIAGPDFEKRENLDKNFYFYSSLELGKELSHAKSWWVVGGFLSVIALATLGVVELLKGLLLLLIVFLLTKTVTLSELRRRAPLDLYFIIGSALGVATVMMQTGAAQILAEGVMWLFSSWGVWGALIGVYLVTMLMTELITNNAAAALGFPIALATSEVMGVSPWPFIMVVAYGASASFMTPYGYQTNLMVYSPGGYRFMDYVRIGVPVSVLYASIVITLTPVFFPF